MTQLAKETQDFLKDLDEVCRKHGLQIDPDLWPVVIDWDEYDALSDQLTPDADLSRFGGDHDQAR